MSPDWQAKAEAFKATVCDVEAMVAAAETTPDHAYLDAVRLSHSTGRIVEAVDGLISRLQRNGADPEFVETLVSLLKALTAADRRAAKLVLQAIGPAEGAGEASVGGPEASTIRRPPRRPWFLGRLEHLPGKFSLAGDGAYGLGVLVEQFDQNALGAPFGPQVDVGRETLCIGELLHEDRNIYDTNAVTLHVSGLKVGHLSRQDAQRFREAADAVGVVGQSVAVAVLVTQGWGRKDGAESSYHVWIDARLPFEFGSMSEQGARSA